MKISLLMLGKTRRPEMRALVDDYVKRIARSCPIDIAEVRDTEAALKKMDADRTATAILLDAGGRIMDSNALAGWLGDLRERGTGKVIVVGGNADGLAEGMRSRIPQK